MYFSRYDDPFAMPRRIPVRRAANGVNKSTDPLFHPNYVAGATRSTDTAPPIEDVAPVANHSDDTGTPVKVRINGSANVPQSGAISVADEPDWKEKAIRLQADMDNFRKRQMRRADDAIAAERERLLAIFLPVVDNLSRALAHNGQDNADSLRKGVELTHRELTRLLEAEGVTPIETTGREFDPEWHEAISVIAAEVESGTIVKEIEPGYKMGDKLLRPAKVVVAA